MPKQRWVTAKVVAALQKALPKCTVTSNMSGGDYDAENIYIGTRGADPLYICAFDWDGNQIETPEDCMVDAVELSDGKDSSGGLHSRKSKTIDAYATTYKCLVKLGFHIVPKMDAYF
jgi:hypothetical protein